MSSCLHQQNKKRDGGAPAAPAAPALPHVDAAVSRLAGGGAPLYWSSLRAG